MFTLPEDTWDYSVYHWILGQSLKRKVIAKSLKIRTIIYNSEATISNCITIETEDNIQKPNINR